MILYSTRELEDVLVEEKIGAGENTHIVVFNDDINTFDWVIESLIEICGHTSQQAEQLSLLIHFKGKATVKTGFFSELKPMQEGLTDRGISAQIES